MNWSAATIIALIEQGVVLIPKFLEMWTNISTAFSAQDKAAVDAALAAARERDRLATEKANADLDAAAQRTE